MKVDLGKVCGVAILSCSAMVFHSCKIVDLETSEMKDVGIFSPMSAVKGTKLTLLRDLNLKPNASFELLFLDSVLCQGENGEILRCSPNGPRTNKSVVFGCELHFTVDPDRDRVIKKGDEFEISEKPQVIRLNDAGFASFLVFNRPPSSDIAARYVPVSPSRVRIPLTKLSSGDRSFSIECESRYFFEGKAYVNSSFVTLEILSDVFSFKFLTPTVVP